jgi:hypothetical protein
MQDATALSQDRGSGARGDLIDYIKKKQEVCQYCDGTIYSKYAEVIPVLKQTLGEKKPMVLTLKFKDVPYGSPGHAVIGLGLANESSWSTTTSGIVLSGKKYDIKILDPNGPKVKTFVCKTYDPNPLIPDLDEGFNCSPAYPTRVGNKFFYIRVLKSKVDQTNSLWGLRDGYCETNPPNDFCQRDLPGYMESNYPEIDNGLEEFENGCCAGWSDVVLKVGYLGQFTSKDFHPNDGNVVGKGCDANHYPSGKSAQAGSTFWLANLWSVIINFNLPKI